MIDVALASVGIVALASVVGFTGAFEQAKMGSTMRRYMGEGLTVAVLINLICIIDLAVQP